ncbi:MAG: rane protein [Chloroflexota bacterium]|jgi:hypothetical protein
MQRRQIWITLLVVSGLALALTLFFATLGPPRSPEASPRSSRVEYRVSGTAEQVRITYLNDIGVEEQRDLAPPWRFGFRARVGRELSLNVQRAGGDGAVACAIAINGQVLTEVPLEESRAEATCTAAVP